MANWWAPATAVAGSILTAQFWNQQVRDNMTVLSRSYLVPEHASGRSYSAAGYHSANGTDGANLLKAIPIVIPSTGTYDRIGLYCASGAAGNARLGIYYDNAGLPGARILDSGSFAVANNSNLQTISQSLPGPALYWLAKNGDNAGPVYDHLTGVGLTGGYNYGSSAGLGGGVGVIRSLAFGALPDPFGTPTTLDADGQPAIFIRKA